MEPHEVVLAFEMLIEELDAIIPELNKQGVQLMEGKNYPDARNVISKAESIIAFQAKVKALREEWLSMAVPPTQKPPKKKKPVKRKVTKRLKQGLRTPNDAFFLPILQALVQLGGSSQVQEVLGLVEENMVEQLNKYDYQSLPSNPKVVRWQNNANWARLKLIQEGLLVEGSPHGVWEITENGKQRVKEESMNNKSISEKSPKYQTNQKEFNYSNDPFSFRPGGIYHRQQDLHDKFGGNRQSGIAACAKAPIVFLFTAQMGDEFGYDDGWASSEIYHYIGEGQTGDMEMTRGNLAIRDHTTDGRELHLFKKVDSGRYEYVGKFKYLRHDIIVGLDAEQNHRKVIRFVLKRAGQ